MYVQRMTIRKRFSTILSYYDDRAVFIKSNSALFPPQSFASDFIIAHFAPLVKRGYRGVQKGSSHELPFGFNCFWWLKPLRRRGRSRVAYLGVGDGVDVIVC